MTTPTHSTGRWRQRAPACAGLLGALLLPLPALSETLQEVYDLARQSDPRFRSAQAESRAIGMALDQAKAAFLPTIKLDMERTKTRQRIIESQNPIFGAGSTTFPTQSDTLSINQPVFRKDLVVRLEQARAVVQQAEFSLLAAEQDLQIRSTASYLSVLAASDSLALAQAERAAVGKVLDTARERLKAGLGTVTSLYDAEARYAVTQAREVEATNKLRDARQGLKEITGKVIDKVQSLKEDFVLESPDPASADQWVESAMTQNLGLRAKTAAVEVARQEIERQRAGHYPSVNLLLSRNRKDTGSTLFGGGSNVETTDFSVRLTVPIFEGGLTSAVTQEAVFRHQKAQEDVEQERRGVERLARAAYDGTLGAVNLVKALKQSVASQQAALAAKEEGLKAGLFALLPVLDAQRDLYLAKRDYEQARYDYLIYRMRLKQAVGTLAEGDILSVSDALR
ncbi:MAG: TolC family outer membrane protein [Rhodoferax sp.]|nr:TolC family outer membrane protein [Rhodoferax sp.]